MSTTPDNLLYSKSHEWVKVEGEFATIGITHHAQAELGDITYLELPEVGRVLQEEEQFGEVESVKAVSELFCPVSGEVVEANTGILNSTEVINEDPYEQGWLIKVRVADKEELAALLNAGDYEKFAGQEGH